MFIKNNNITIRQIIVVVSGIILIYLGIPNIVNGLEITSLHFDNSITDPNVLWTSVLYAIGFGLAFVVSGIVLLFKSKLIRVLIKNKKS